MIDVARVRNAAVATIQPLVEASRCRLDDIPSSIWLEPYMIGLLGMLITLAAERQTRPIKGAAMRQVQTEVWRTITGLDYRIGEEIMLLSASQDEQFLAGCMDAASIASDLYDYEAVAPLGLDAPNLQGSSLSADQVAVRQVRDIVRWRETFDTYVMRRQ
ncbi:MULTISPECIES: hypothetical protein [unclassified Bradyrhizobium]